MVWLLPLLLAQLDTGLVFEWHAAEGCPAEAGLRARLDGLAGQAIATVTTEGARWLLDVRVNGRQRTLSTASCDEAAEAAVLIIQLGLANAAPPPAEPSPRLWSLRASLFASTWLAWFPAPQARFGGSVSFHGAHYALLLDVSTVLPVRFAVGPTEGAAIVVRLPIDVQVGGCWMLEWRALRAGPCAQASLAWLEASGEGVTLPKSAAVPVWSVGPAARAFVSLTSWLDVVGGVGVRFGARPILSFGDAEPSLRAASALVDSSLGLGLKL